MSGVACVIAGGMSPSADHTGEDSCAVHVTCCRRQPAPGLCGGTALCLIMDGSLG